MKQSKLRQPLCIIALLCLCALTGCTPPAFLEEEKNFTQDAPKKTIVPAKKDYNTDFDACEDEARQNKDYDSGLMGSMKMKNLIKKCMASKGWALRDD